MHQPTPNHPPTSDSATLHYRIQSGWAAVFLATVIAGLLCLHIVFSLLHWWYPQLVGPELYKLFSVDGPSGVASLFSAAQTLLAAGLFWVIGEAESRRVVGGIGSFLHWAGLACVFLFLAADDALSIHDRFDRRILFHFLGKASDAVWIDVIVYGGAALLFTTFYLRFWLRLPPRFRWRFAASAAIYLSGALILEVLGIIVYRHDGGQSIRFIVTQAVEEGLEMAGIAALIATQLTWLKWRQVKLCVDVR